MPSRTVDELYEGGREQKEAKIAELRRQLEEKEQANLPFKPTLYTQGRFPEVCFVCVCAAACVSVINACVK